MAIILGLIAVAVPVCTTGACDLASGLMPGSSVPHDGMSLGGMSHSAAPVFKAVCDMASRTAGVVENALPPSSPTLLIGLFAALALALVSLVPRLTLFRLLALVGDPPAPPGDPRGVCLLI